MNAALATIALGLRPTWVDLDPCDRDIHSWSWYHQRVGRIAKAIGLLVTVGLGACAPSRFVCPAKGGPPWREVSSQNFVLRSDLGPGAAEDMVREFEFVRAALVQAMFHRPIRTQTRLEVVAFRSRDELAEYTSEDVAGQFQRDTLGRQRILVADFGPAQRLLIAHELTHYLAFHVVHRQPLWFAEGVATYYETVAKRGLFQKPEVGTVPDTVRAWLLSCTPYCTPWRAKTVFTWTDAGSVEQGFYGTSWLLVHFLVNQRGKSFTELQTRLARAEEPRAAWNAVFPEWSLEVPGATEKLDAELKTYLLHGAFSYRELHVESSVAVSQRLMSPAEVHALRLSMPRRWRPGELEAEIGEALAEDPGHIEALRRRAALSRADATAAARRAVEAHPDDPRAWGFLADALSGTLAEAEREAAFRKAVDLAPDDVEVLVPLAEYLRDAGRSGEALPTSQRAVEIAPWSPAALLVHATILADLGRCADAALASRRAIDLTGEGYSAEARQECAKLARQIGEECPVRGGASR